MIGFHIESHAPTKSHISKQRQTVRWIKCFSCVCLRLLSIKLISLAFSNFRNRPSDAFLSSLFITHESYLLLSQYWKEFNHTNINPKKNICLIETHTHTKCGKSIATVKIEIARCSFSYSILCQYHINSLHKFDDICKNLGIINQSKSSSDE